MIKFRSKYAAQKSRKTRALRNGSEDSEYEENLSFMQVPAAEEVNEKSEPDQQVLQMFVVGRPPAVLL